MPPEEEDFRPPVVVQCEHEDELEFTKARLVYVAGITALATPPAWLVLTFLAALWKVNLVLDERILVASLTASASILGCAFGNDVVHWAKKVFRHPH